MNDLITHLKEEQQAKRKGGLYHKTQVSLAYNSNRIEGSRLTEEQTRYIFETRTIG
ncbi:MAG: cell filamentation protein Fic, partial [Bacteroidales bacterium]|nr:cell filamentation protein Fic [Bacteroidales bacterium]